MGLLDDIPTTFGNPPNQVELWTRGRRYTWKCTCGETGWTYAKDNFDRQFIRARARWHAELNDKDKT